MKSPIKPIDTPNNLFRDGNPATGVLGDIVKAAWLNAVQGATIALQNEIVAVLGAAGIVADEKTTSHQLLDALNKIYAGLNSPALTGAPTTPTPAANDKSKRIANTEFVHQVVSAIPAVDLNGKQDKLGYQPPQAVSGRRNSVIVNDSRATVYTPKDRDAGVYFDFVNNKANGLTDGGTQHGAITFRQYGAAADFSGGLAHQLCFTDNENIWHRSGKDAVWQGWRKLWHSGNFDPATKQNALGFMPVQQGGGVGQLTNLVRIGWSNGKGLKVTVDATDQGTVVFGDRPIRLNWNGLAGQPPWLLGGASADAVNLYNPSNFRVAYAATAGGATAAEKIGNGQGYMRFQWSDPGGQPGYIWGSDGPTTARLATTANLKVGHAREADNAQKIGGIPIRYAENNNVQPHYFYGAEPGKNEITLFTRSQMAVGSSVTATYAHQLTGQGLVHGGIGGYHFNNNHTTSGLPGTWEPRGSAYDYGSSHDGEIGSRHCLWQRRA